MNGGTPEQLTFERGGIGADLVPVDDQGGILLLCVQRLLEGPAAGVRNLLEPGSSCRQDVSARLRRCKLFPLALSQFEGESSN